MGWDETLGPLFEDLEQQAAGLHLSDRDAEVADRSRAEYASVTFLSRVRATTGRTVTLHVAGVGALTGRLVRVGEGWLLLETPGVGHEWIVLADAVCRVSGLASASVSEAATPATARLGVASALRSVARSRAEVVTHHRDASSARGRLTRVGADFTELVMRREDRRETVVVPFAELAGVHQP